MSAKRAGAGSFCYSRHTVCFLLRVCNTISKLIVSVRRIIIPTGWTVSRYPSNRLIINASTGLITSYIEQYHDEHQG